MNSKFKNWLDCDDEMKMSSFLDAYRNEIALRKFAILNAESVDDLLVDNRSRNAINVAQAFVDGNATEVELEQAYNSAVSALQEILTAFGFDEDDPTEFEEKTEYAALVALWAAYPVGHTGASSLECARESALHTAYYCYKLDGSRALEEQLDRFVDAGMLD